MHLLRPGGEPPKDTTPTKMTLLEKQQLFTVMAARFILQATRYGHRVVFGEFLRPKSEAELNAKQGDGIKNSNHCIKLAFDVLLFDKDGKYLTDSEDYRILANVWKVLAKDWPEVEFCWGGDFKKPDGGHFSFEHNGVR